MPSSPVQHADVPDTLPTIAVYGAPPLSVTESPRGALQVSPLHPGASALEDVDAGSLEAVVMSAPPGTRERRRQLALALRALAAGGRLTALAPGRRGGARLRKELEAFGCVVEESARRHHRICTCARPDPLVGAEQAIDEGAGRWLEHVSMWSQPGVFSWDRVDPASALLSNSLPVLSGAGADLGCGIGHLARTVLQAPEVTRLVLLDIDARAIAAARRNIEDPRAELRWADVRAADAAVDLLADLDFVVTNPPFHDGGVEDRELGKAFIRCAAGALRRGGALWLVANRHLPYEAVLRSEFAHIDVRVERDGYKVIEARR